MHNLGRSHFIIMGFQRHETEEDKQRRKDKYWCLVNIAKIEPRKALIFRDWTDNKVRMILNGEAHPIR